MTTDLIELSKQAAEVLGIEPKEIYPSHFSFTDKTIHSFSTLWLAEDIGRCAEIAADRMLDTTHSKGAVIVWYWNTYKKGDIAAYDVEVYLADHNGDREQAWRVAVLKAVIEQEKQS